ncbi:Retrovirus-related Pol polyprotein from transposon RE1 [Vitis vinifera]|uniref:Retrovirus-related Pol polyprotein from transposon RE1 n=1 Tax=Vitis vinifera TaxID=29760 RepID=A0A438IC10_VITVI|nr:Retrovirus-related Pol polyprotein from transposon RE1 [Vitis vinifera]
MKTLMRLSIKLDKDEKGKSINSTMYKGMIGSLLYLTASRPDIMCSVCLCARFQSCPKESHLSARKRILRYLKGTIDIGLWYPKGDNFELIGFSDVDFTGCKVERKSTSGTCHFLGHSLVSWYSKKQNSVALSTAKAEYIVVEPRVFILGVIPLLPGASARFNSISVRLGLLVGFRSLLFGFVLSSNFISSFSAFLMALRREIAASRAQGKRPTESSQPDQTEARRKASRMGWLPVVTISKPIFLTLVRAFYSRVTYGVGGPIMSTIRGVEIRLSPESICCIFDIPSVGLRVYESKVWPTMSGFEPREAIQRLYSLANA